ncbi:MAG TPA: ParB/RepB/Spo0J family partition protein [Candidatus Sulfotelmatobacter sp.]|jgi:ParB family chromosome partitioning protein|nr:ParB/RepB/Spo0J family partition protein [Candidatus Sulfotelmatobacter sp.]
MSATVAAEKKDEKVEKRKALGRGLASLLPGPRVVTSAESRTLGGGSGPAIHDSAAAGETKVPRFARDDKRVDSTALATHPPSSAQEFSQATGVHANALQHDIVAHLDMELIDKNPYQTRYVFDEEPLQELADSIRESGVVQPVVVRSGEQDGRYILVLGERRLRASKMAGKSTIPALVRRLSPQQAAEMTVLENVQREDLNPIEQAEAFRVLSKEFQLTQAQIAERVGVSRETVANYMRLLRLPQQVMGYLVSGRLSFSDCRELLALQKEEHILQVAEEVVTKHLKWDEIEDRVARLNGFLPEPGVSADMQKQARGARWMDPNVRAAQTEMERTLGMRVRIKDRNGKGKIVIEYATVDDYERVVEMLRGK